MTRHMECEGLPSSRFDPKLARFIELSQGAVPHEDERDIVTLARLNNPDVWRLRDLTNAHNLRVASLQAADRILSHESAARSAMAWEEPHRATWMGRVAAWVFSSRVGVAS